MKPLAGIRIVDLTVAVAGPVAAHILGDLGAEVIRVEPPFARPTRHHDVAPRTEEAPERPYNRVVSYNDLHRSKRGMTLDLARPAEEGSQNWMIPGRRRRGPDTFRPGQGDQR